VLEERTESSRTFAQPNGLMRMRKSVEPKRVRRGADWVGVNTDLKPAGGDIVPEATALDLRFSDGGPGPLLTVTRGGRSLSLLWPGELPPPTLDGDTATYAEVLPGVDLKLAAGVDSFSEVLVVKTPEAAKNAELHRIQFGLDLQGVSMKQDLSGFLRAEGPSGETVFVSDGARMWDSPKPVAAGMRMSAARQVDPPRTEDVPVVLSPGSLTVVPSQAMLNDSSAGFPMFIDPGFAGGKETWTHINRKNPDRSYWTDKASRKNMRVGQLWNGTSTDDWRTIVHFGIKELQGTQILKASVIANAGHTGGCSATPIRLWLTSPISTGKAVTWNTATAEGKRWRLLGEDKASANKQACPKGNDPIEFGQTLVKTMFQAAADASDTSITFAFLAKSEGDHYQWKKLVPDSAELDIEYNRKPNKPGLLAMSPCGLACSTAPVSNRARPTLTMAVSDPEGGTLTYRFEVWDSARKKLKAASGQAVTNAKSGTLKNWTLNLNLANGNYSWRTFGCDKLKFCGPMSDWHNFAVDIAGLLRSGVAPGHVGLLVVTASIRSCGR
jgi:hypothetical protein